MYCEAMVPGKMNFLLDQAWGSSGKGKTSAWLADKHSVTAVSSSNFPNAGHTARFSDGTKFVAKAIPTAAILKRARGMDMECFISPGSGFSWRQLFTEWMECGRPRIRIHERASLVTEEHRRREQSGLESTKHVASTMQGSAAAIVDKVLRKQGCLLAGNTDVAQAFKDLTFDKEFYDHVVFSTVEASAAAGSARDAEEDLGRVELVRPDEFRSLTWAMISAGQTWLHEGSQGYALSIDHGSHYPHCTSRNCTLQASMDHMAVPPSLVGDVYLNLRSMPIRVGNVVEDGQEVGFSGDFYPDCEELSWAEVAKRAGMPPDEAAALAERERTTVTKRIRRVCTFSWIGLKDAVRANGATKLVVNFAQYLNWKDAGLRGGKEAFQKLSKESRDFVSRVEETSGVPVVLIGTGADHEDMVCLL